MSRRNLVRSLARFPGFLVAACVTLAATGWWTLHGSLPRYDGRIEDANLRSAVVVERDALGTVTLHAGDRIDAAFDYTNEVRGFINEGWEAYRKQLHGIVAARGDAANFDAAARQAYIGLGVALVAAAAEGVDSTPMEGFDPAAVDQILGLKERNLRSVVILPLGYRQPEGDWLVNLKKVRRPREKFVTELV